MRAANQGTPDATSKRLNGRTLKIGIVQARFNESVTTALTQACQAELIALGVLKKNITLVQVPGALEIPLALFAMADKLEHDALIAIGCIIRGETYHFELVANESAAGVSEVALEFRLPVANAILTTENLQQAVERQKEKGRDAACVAVEMANLLKEI